MLANFTLNYQGGTILQHMPYATHMGQLWAQIHPWVNMSQLVVARNIIFNKHQYTKHIALY